MRLDVNEYDPVEMVGDGKLPNVYWVTPSTHFGVLTNDGMEWAEDLMEENGIEPATFASTPFDTFAEAKNFAMMIGLEQEPQSHGVNSIVIEDRIGGVIWETRLLAYKRKKWGGWGFEKETFDDTSYTREHLESKGVEFE